ncbi:ABC transporter ATP-binding protein [Aquibium carbonis]|uniref:ABC transporter ATP-binding protein n=1 Tax=Aquibium carbonis TaxID=2495581 RepID=A0A3S0A4M8_9HYPH|nr:ABC transporter ATP-binding protein [Aquibium carbonis]RST83875.1 ABC transporter ATP-binding protein [Aquibium carbonis]
MSRLSVRSLVKTWDETRAVDGVSFATEAREFVALLGPSGCGKSTTLRLIAGLEAATEGSVEIDGLDVTNLPPASRRISMVFQSYALFPHLNVADNILFGLSVRGVKRAEQKQRLDRIVPLLGLSSLLDRRPSQLSGGQQQRVALGRALIAEAPVCLLDEPLSNLDAKLRAEMRNEIRSLQQRLGLTMLFVTHDQTEAMSMADRVVLLRDGKVEQFATPSDLYTKPNSVFVAQFIGTPPMNILDATLLGPAWDRLPKNTLVGVRPEHIRFADRGIAATVVSMEYFGADSVVSCRIADKPVLVRVPGQPGFAGGETVHLSWPQEAQHLFDQHSGKRRDPIPDQRLAPALEFVQP